MDPFRIADVRAFALSQEGVGGDYHDREEGHWLVDSLIANPMSVYPEYKESRTSWGIAVLGSLVVEIETDSGVVGVATGFGGAPACYLIEKHFRRFLIGSDIRDTARLFDQMFRASLPYGRKGLPLAAISVVDLALWDAQGIVRGEPVYKLIGGETKAEIPLYCTGPRPDIAKELGFWGGKVPLPHGPCDGHAGLSDNCAFLADHREKVGDSFPLMVDCYMSLNVPYAVDLANAIRELNINWLEECLHPDDFDGHRHLKERVPWMKWTTGEHEYSRYGFRKLIESRSVDILQPDMMWLGGLTEAIRVAAMASAYDIPVVPHGSGAYSYHYVMALPHSPFCEYLITSSGAETIEPVFGGLFDNEILPVDGKIRPSDEPGFGMKLKKDAFDFERPYAES